MKEHERKGLLERIDRDGATVGTSIPEELDIQGEVVALRDLVFELRALDTPIEADRLVAAKKRLRRERRERRQRIEAGEVSYDRGEEDAQAIVGIDRALSILADHDDRDLDAEMAAESVADTQRWMTFLRQVLGQEEGRRSRP